MGNNYGSIKVDYDTSPTATLQNNINVACYNVYFEGYNRQGTIDGIFYLLFFLSILITFVYLNVMIIFSNL